MMLDWQCRLLEHYRFQMTEMGLEVIPSTDFEQLEAVVKRMSPKGDLELTPHFSTDENTFTTRSRRKLAEAYLEDRADDDHTTNCAPHALLGIETRIELGHG